MACGGFAEARDKCGVCALRSGSEFADELYGCMLSIQHRGQESCGFSFLDRASGKVITKKQMGLVNQLFSEHGSSINGTVGIGHVRYSTSGASNVHNAQPFEVNGFHIAFNGNVANYDSIRKSLLAEHEFRTDSDTELIAYCFSKAVAGAGTNEQLFSRLAEQFSGFSGAFSIVGMDSKGRLFALRDPWGFKPFVLGQKGDSVCITSESAALVASGFSVERDIGPGEALIIDSSGIHSKKILEQERRAMCMFEFVYFARPDSTIEGRNVELVREELGRELGRLAKPRVDFDIIVPVPDSGRSAAQGLAEAYGKPIKEALIKNRYIHRTFIMPGNEKRTKLISMKMSPVVELIKGKRIALVDDSIVRGNTMKRLVALLKSAGAREVHLFISCPKIIAPCFMGIDFPTYSELIGADKETEEIRKFLCVESLTYMTVPGLEKSIGLKNSLCMACLTNSYPIEIDSGTLERAKSGSVNNSERKGCC